MDKLIQFRPQILRHVPWGRKRPLISHGPQVLKQTQAEAARELDEVTRADQRQDVAYTVIHGLATGAEAHVLVNSGAHLRRDFIVDVVGKLPTYLFATDQDHFISGASLPELYCRE